MELDACGRASPVSWLRKVTRCRGRGALLYSTSALKVPWKPWPEAVPAETARQAEARIAAAAHRQRGGPTDSVRESLHSPVRENEQAHYRERLGTVPEHARPQREARTKRFRTACSHLS